MIVFEDDNFVFRCLKGGKKDDIDFVEILYNEKETKIDDLVNRFSEFLLTPEKNKKYVNLLSISNGNLSMVTKEIPNGQIDISENYGVDFSTKYEKMINQLNEKNPGLFLLHSKPGTGKTSLIKDILGKLGDSKVLFIPAMYSTQLGDTSFTNFLLTNKIDVIIIEDAENALRSRENGSNPAVATLLNMTDGIIGDVFNIRIIATFNTPRENIDEALLRPGRLKFIHEFGPLSVDQSNNLMKKLNHPPQNKEMTLAEIYNFGIDTGIKKKEQPKVGFAACA